MRTSKFIRKPIHKSKKKFIGKENKEYDQDFFSLSEIEDENLKKSALF